MSNYLEMSFKSINCFADDGQLDIDELNKLVAIALKDGAVDADEKRVLGNIIAKLKPAELTSTLQRRVDELREKYAI